MSNTEPNAPSDPLYSKRVEDKYVLPIKSFDRVVAAIEDRLKAFYPDEGTEYTCQESVYLETPGLDFVIDHLQDLNTRYKMRLRYYGPNGKWSKDTFMEVKYRENGDQKKVRIAVDTYAMTCIFGSKPIPSDVIKLNKDIPQSEYDKAVKIINMLSAKYELSPISAVEYTRLSYKNKDGSVRVTVDRDIKVSSRRTTKSMSSQPIKDAGLFSKLKEYDNKFNPDKNYVVEIKYADGEDTPDWFSNLMIQEDDHFEGMSKFAWGLSQVLK
ncbi:MAG: hypothetical protein NVS1B10_03200 [Candidatus Saccharimonadales bacterium]